MRWQPDAPVCAECGFDWSTPRDEAIATVDAGPGQLSAALAACDDPLGSTGDRWSPSMYVWHLVDVLRIGAERLLTISLDPSRPVPCWDENVLAKVRQYAALSPTVGVAMLAMAAEDWVHVAVEAPEDGQVGHAEYGEITALDIIRRNAHEVHHHLYDVGRES